MKKLSNKITILSFSILIIITLSIVILILINNKESRVCIKKICFNIEIAKTQEEREKGLMYRSHLEENKGMLFIFQDEEIYPFWMKNTLIPLDIIWINKDLEIVEIKNNFQPCEEDSCPSYKPKQKAFYVLEINAGLAEKYGFKEGDKIYLN